jgi:hypothetical protein
MPLTSTLKICGDSATPLSVQVGPTSTTVAVTGKPKLDVSKVEASATLSPVAISLPTIEIGVAPEFLTLLALLLSGAPGLLGQIIQQVEGLGQDWINKIQNLGGDIANTVSGLFKGIKLSAPIAPGVPVDPGAGPTLSPGQQPPQNVAAAAALLLPLISIKLGTIKISALQEKGVVGPTIALNLNPFSADLDLDAVQVQATVQALNAALAGCLDLNGTLGGSLP